MYSVIIINLYFKNTEKVVDVTSSIPSLTGRNHQRSFTIKDFPCIPEPRCNVIYPAKGPA